MLKKSLAILLFCIPTIFGCSSKKDDLSLENGKYFVKSLGRNAQQNDFQQQIHFSEKSKQKSNYDYRAGSLDAKISSDLNLTKNVFGTNWNSNVKISSEPTFIKDGLIKSLNL